jgi:hypothetical protein
MRQRTLWALAASVLAAACGGSNFASVSDGGGGGDGGSSSSSGGSGSSSGRVGDSGLDAPVAACDGGLTSCKGKCVDTGNDPQNCGGCGVVCNTQCVAGVCALIIADAGTPPKVGDNACLAIDATNVYWGTGLAGGSVWKVPITGGAPTQLVGGQAAPHGMASDGTTLFYGNQGTGATCTGSIESIPIGGTTPAQIASGQCVPLDVAVDAKNVYWTDSGDGSVWQSDKTNPNPMKIAGGNGAAPGYLRVDATSVYFTSAVNGTGVVSRVPIGGGTVITVTSSVPSPGHIAIDATHAYFGSRGMSTAAILAVGLNGMGANPAQTVTNLPAINGIETDGTHIWFAEAIDVQPYMANTGEIHRVTVGGANDKILASMQNGPNCIAVDATSVYWIEIGGGMIAKTSK